jgi:predicted NBD/HSP70 family sugar kinase
LTTRSAVSIVFAFVKFPNELSGSVTWSMSRPEVGTPGQLRAMNERRVLDLVLRTGAISRAQIARETGLSKPTVSLALVRLEEAQLLREVGRTSGGRGATALLYDIDPTAGYALALDLGREWVRAAIADLGGRTLARQVERTRGRTADALVGQLSEVTRRLLGTAEIQPASLAAATLGSPGVILPERDHVRLAPSLPGLQQRGVVDRLRAELGVDLQVENDVNLAATAELALGWGREASDFVYLSIGTGVGMALVLDGALRRGATGAAGEVGFLPVPNGRVGRPARVTELRTRGAFESSVAADAIVRAARRQGLRSVRTARQVAAAARAGDLRARRVVEREAELLATGLAAVTAVVDPAVVVLGGGIGLGFADLLVEPLTGALHGLTPLRPAVVTSRLDADAVLSGALASALIAAQEAVFGRVTWQAATHPSERAYHAGVRIAGQHPAPVATVDAAGV